MMTRSLIVVAMTLMVAGSGSVLAQTTTRGQAVSPGQSRADNRLPQPPSGGRATGSPASGPQTDAERQAEDQAKRSTTICKGC